MTAEVCEGGEKNTRKPVLRHKRLEKFKREGPGPARRDGRGRWSPTGVMRVGLAWGGFVHRRAGEDQSEQETLVAMCPASHVFPRIVLQQGPARVSAARREIEEGACPVGWGVGDGGGSQVDHRPPPDPTTTRTRRTSGRLMCCTIGAEPVSVFAAVPSGEVTARVMRGRYHATGGTSRKSHNCHDAHVERVLLRHMRRDYSADEDMQTPEPTFFLPRSV